MGTMSHKKLNIELSETKTTVAENLRLPTILPSKPRDPRSLGKPVMIATPPTAAIPGETRRKRRAPSVQITPVSGDDANNYVTEYRESLVLPPLDDRHPSSANTVICDNNVFLKVRAAKTKSPDHQHSNAYLKSAHHHNNNMYPKLAHHYGSNSAESSHHHGNNAYLKSTYHHSNNAYLQSAHHHNNNVYPESAHHHSNSTLVPSSHDSNTKGTLSLNLRFSAFHSLRSASENDTDAEDVLCSTSPSLADPNRKTLYLVMKKYDSEPEFRVWPPDGGEERRRMSSVDFLCDESESDEEGMALSLDIDWEDFDLASTPSLSPNLE